MHRPRLDPYLETGVLGTWWMCMTAGSWMWTAVPDILGLVPRSVLQGRFLHTSCVRGRWEPQSL